MNILVTEGENRSTLAVTRSLGRRGCRVVVTGKMNRNLSSCSRYCQQSYSVPEPLNAGSDYAATIAEIATREEIDVIFPMTEQSIYLLNQAREMMPNKTIMACPTADKMSMVADKVTLCKLAEKLGVPFPRTLYLTGPQDLASRVREIERYPVVVKPALSRIQDTQGFISGGVRYATSQAELLHIYATQESLRFPSMIQEMIVGPGTGLFTLYDTNRHIALFSHRRLREKPPSGGVSVVSESVPLDREMVEAADRLLSAVGWTGVGMVEFKRDIRDGKAKLMEINGRFWGSLQLSIACGVDFPGLYLDYLQMGKQEPIKPDYSVGHKLKWFWGTLDHLLIRLKNGDSKLNLPTENSKLEAFYDFLKIFEENSSFDVFDKDDVGPFIFESKSYLRYCLRG